MLKKYSLQIVILMAFLGGCTEDTLEFDNEVAQTEDIPVQLDQSNPVLQGLLKEGFNINDIQEYQDYYVVEGDIVVLKVEPSDDTFKDGRTGQARTDRIVAPAFRNIKVYLNQGSFSSINLSTPLNSSIAAINAINSEIKLTRVFSASSANIIIAKNNGLGSNVCGRAGFPFSNGRPFNKVDISESTLTNLGLTSVSQLTLLVAHELGHCIGLRHTNWKSRGESGGITIANTPTVDNASVMNGGTCGNPWNNFSNFDRVAIQVLYNTIPQGSDRLVPGQRLLKNQFISSQDGRFKLILQGDGNLVLYKFNVPLWHTQTHGKPQINRCVMQTDGNLVLYDTSNRAHWDSGTWRYPGSWLVMQNDGNLVIYEGGLARWDSQTCCH